MCTIAGWYPDPADAAQDRWWDGRAWSDHRRPRAGAPFGAPPGSLGPVPTSHGPATTSLVLGIVSLVLCGFFTGIPAMVVGRRAAREIDASGGRLDGRGLATAGFATGLIGTLWSGLVTLLVIGVFVAGSSVQSGFEDTCTVVTSDGTSASC